MNTPAPTPSMVGTLVSGRYRIQQLLGEGGMGAVYLAEHTHMRKRVALKLLHSDMSQDEEVLARFKREAEAAAHVEHPNVASATDFGQTEDGSFFLVLEYVEGKSLRDEIDKGPLAPRRALHIARQMVTALERAHGAGIVHRDLKPENVMLVEKADDPDFVKVLDFGIAKVESANRVAGAQPLTRLGTILGTPEYMAPEQAMGETVGPQADLYAVGVMLYEMLTSKHPFDAPDRMAVLSMHIVAPVPAMTDRNPAIDVPPSAEAVTKKLLEKDANGRPQGARAVIDEIDIAAAQAGIELPMPNTGRGFGGRESSPGAPPASVRSMQAATSTPATPSADIPTTAPSPPPSSQVWNEGDAVAKTEYGLPAPPSQDGPKLPRFAIIGIASIPAVVLLLIVTIILARRSGADSKTALEGAGSGSAGSGAAPPAPRATKAPPDKLRAATTQGVSALESLAQQYPEDPAVQRQIIMSLDNAGRTGEALRAIHKLLKLEKADDALVAMVVSSAQRPDSADDAFVLLEGPLGAPGIDALIEMASAKTAVGRRATKALTQSTVRSAASPAASVFLELKSAKDCNAKHDVIERAKDAGDARVLSTLKSMKNPRGCGFMGMRDCYPCLRKDDALDDAIAGIESRAK